MCFAHFGFDVCFSPQCHALFVHLNCQKCSEHGVLYAFWLQNVLRATTLHLFNSSTSKSAPNPLCFYYFQIQMCFAPQRRAIFDFISPDSSPPAALASLLLDPPEPQNIARLFYLFARIHLLSFDSFSSLIFFLLPSLLWLFPPLLFHVSILSILSEVWLPNFLWQFICLKLYWYIIRIYYTLCIYTYVYNICIRYNM